MPPFQKIPYSWRWLVCLLPVFVVALVITAGFYDGLDPKPVLGPFPQKGGNGPSAPDSLPGVIRALWAPLVLPIAAPVFTTIDGKTNPPPPPDELVHTEPLGKWIFIPVLAPATSATMAAFFPPVSHVENLGSPATGFLNHYSRSTQKLAKDAAPIQGQSQASLHVRHDFLDGYSVNSHLLYIHVIPCNGANGQ
ncbi:hypothetical protein VTI28DRAFT_9434 [Corynascus sepedonium]